MRIKFVLNVKREQQSSYKTKEPAGKLDKRLVTMRAHPV